MYLVGLDMGTKASAPRLGFLMHSRTILCKQFTIYNHRRGSQRIYRFADELVDQDCLSRSVQQFVWGSRLCIH
jgi:hypothetical protein